MKLVLDMEVGLSPGDFALDVDPVPSPKKGRSPPPQFSAHFCCGQTARCIKMPLGMDVGLSPGDFLLDGDPVFPPQQRRRSPLPIFGPFLSPGEFVLDGDPAPSQKGGRSPSPILRVEVDFRNWTESMVHFRLQLTL